MTVGGKAIVKANLAYFQPIMLRSDIIELKKKTKRSTCLKCDNYFGN